MGTQFTNMIVLGRRKCRQVSNLKKGISEKGIREKRDHGRNFLNGVRFDVMRPQNSDLPRISMLRCKPEVCGANL